IQYMSDSDGIEGFQLHEGTHTWRPSSRALTSQDYVPGLRSRAGTTSTRLFLGPEPTSDPEVDLEGGWTDETPVGILLTILLDGGIDGTTMKMSHQRRHEDDEVLNGGCMRIRRSVEHPAPADSVVVALPATDQAPSAEETEPFKTDEYAATPPPHPAYRVIARISIPAPVLCSLWLCRGIALGPRYKVGESSSAATARPAGGLRVDYGFIATMDREIRRDPEREVGYGITDSWDEIVETLQGALVSTDMELGRHMTTFETRVRQDTDEIYTRLDDEQSHRQLLAGRLNMLFRDRRAHAYTHHQIETEARLSLEAWRRSMDESDLARGEETGYDFRDAEGKPEEICRDERVEDS
ncbi:hypothetical protein Tco_0949117, partial [Tanacetum coccineum]